MREITVERNQKLLDCYQRMNQSSDRATDRCIQFAKELLDDLPIQPLVSFSNYGSIHLDFLDEDYGVNFKVEIHDLYCAISYLDGNQIVYKRVPTNTIRQYLLDKLNHCNKRKS